MPEDSAARARAIIEANAYMTLATADGDGVGRFILWAA